MSRAISSDMRGEASRSTEFHTFDGAAMKSRPVASSRWITSSTCSLPFSTSTMFVTVGCRSRAATPGRRRSQSTMIVLRPPSAELRASEVASVVFPSWGSADVTTTLTQGLCGSPNASAERTDRIASA